MVDIKIDKNEIYTKERFDSAIGTANTFMCNFTQLKNPIIDEFGNEYYNSEGYYMSQRTNNLDEKKQIAIDSKLSGKESRSARYKYNLEQDEYKRFLYMVNTINKKFTLDPDLSKKLLNTFDKEIIEKNYWQDDLFGVKCDTLKGANLLGKILMSYRDSKIAKLNSIF